MRKLIVVPIEPLEERYTHQWYHLLPKEFATAGFDVTIIDGTVLQDTIKVGAFLDINSTIHYKNTQMAKIASMFDQNLIEDGTVFFFGDMEYWGIESLRLMADMNKVSIKICAFLHAASHTKEDAFSIASSYQQYTEVGWVAAMDKVFVGSNYAKQAFIDRRLAPLGADHLAEKIVVTGNPLFPEIYLKEDRTDAQVQIVLTNRFDPEKRPGETLQLFLAAYKRHPDWKFTVTTSRNVIRGAPEDINLLRYLAQINVVQIRENLSKEDYYRILVNSDVMVTHSPEESYGYCIAEALIHGCAVLAKDCASHPEMLDYETGRLFDDNLSNWSLVNRLEALVYKRKYAKSNARHLLGANQKLINELLTC
jgi:glycosyltransferase involved in cell wall biosynthesis